MAPAGTPKAIVDELNKEINAVLQTPDIQARIAKNAAQSYNWSPEEFGKFVKARSSVTARSSGCPGRSRWTDREPLRISKALARRFCSPSGARAAQFKGKS